MAIFAAVDIETDDAGEIQVENGSIAVASTKRSHIQLLDFTLKTNYSEYTPAPLVAANFEEFIGDPNVSRTHNLMLQNFYEALRLQGIFTPADVAIRIVPIDLSEVAVLVRLSGEFSEANQDDVTSGWQTLAYRYPFPDGTLEQIDLSEL
jgi:hypothetical protein